MAKLKTVPPVPVASAAAPPAAKSRLPLILSSIIVVLLLCLGGGAFYWWTHRPANAPTEHKQAEKKPPVFVNLEPFTVNLLPESGDHYLQVGVVYQVTEDKTVDALKLYMPVIRNRILLLLSGKKPSDLAQVDGKQKLVMELVLSARDSLPGEPGSERGIAG